jgi:DNA processing protein
MSPLSVGTNDLLKQGAVPVTDVDDILAVLGGGPADKVARGAPHLEPQESSVWEALERNPRHVDDLARALGERAGEVSATLAMLELKGLARQVGSMLYTRA